MRVLIVTSQVTFVPQNYLQFLKNLFEAAEDLLVGVMFVKNLNAQITKQTLFAGIAGAHRIAKQILINISTAIANDPRKALCKKYNIKYYFVNSINSQETLSLLKSLQLDLILNARTREIYNASVLEIPKLGCINIHHGILPEERGIMCDLHALAAGKPAGFSIHKMTPKLDDGDLFETHMVTTSPTQNFLEHTSTGASAEGIAAAQFIQRVAALNALPICKRNTSPNIVYRKSKLGWKEIRSLKKSGMLL